MADEESGLGKKVFCGVSIIGLILTIIGISFSLIFLLVPIINIVIGAVFLNQCPIEKLIPVWLIVSGSVGIFIVIFLDIVILVMVSMGISAGFKAMKEKLGQAACQVAMISCVGISTSFIIGVFTLFAFAWFIAGNVWVFSNYSKVQYDSNQSNYCHITCYRYAFASIIITYAFSGLGFCFSAFSACSSCISTCLGAMLKRS